MGFDFYFFSISLIHRILHCFIAVVNYQSGIVRFHTTNLETDMNINQDMLLHIMPNAKSSDIQNYMPSLQEKLQLFEINSPIRVAHFLSQIAHESGELRYKSENLNYSARALRLVFSKYFESDEIAEQYARQPEKIANVVYANRMGNGDIASGEGWKYRGRGLIQLTGKENYCKCEKALGLPLSKQPDGLANDPNSAVIVACYFWHSHGLNQLADQDDLKAITRRINGGYNGLEDRAKFLNRAKQYLEIEGVNI